MSVLRLLVGRMLLWFQEQSFAVMAEDVSFTEIQQEGLDRAGRFEPVAIRADATLIQARRAVDRLRECSRSEPRWTIRTRCSSSAHALRTRRYAVRRSRLYKRPHGADQRKMSLVLFYQMIYLKICFQINWNDR